MNVAVLSLTRDRLDYTKNCFASLHEFAGCSFDHFILDQASTDGTARWLIHEYDCELYSATENMGISRGWNFLIDNLVNVEDYDVIVKFDNDCELVQPDTLRRVCELVMSGGAILSPRILGLQKPPRPVRELRIGDELILDIPQIGGIFLAAPAWVYEEFRYSESNPTWGGDDVEICRWWREQGGTCGYVKSLEAWHYEGTSKQHERFPDYWERKQKEMAA